MVNRTSTILASFISFSILFSSNAFGGNWKYVGVAGLSTGEYNLYVDLTSLKRDKNTVTMHELHSFRFEQFAPEGGYRSQTQIWEYECEEMLTRGLEKILFEKSMGKGQILTKRAPYSVDWRSVKPGEAVESKLRVACELSE